MGSLTQSEFQAGVFSSAMKLSKTFDRLAELGSTRYPGVVLAEISHLSCISIVWQGTYFGKQNRENQPIIAHFDLPFPMMENGVFTQTPFPVEVRWYQDRHQNF